MALFLFLILVAVVLGIVGVVVKGLFYLLIIGIVVFLLAFVVVGRLINAGRRQRPAR
jgi:hypothetical protein